MLGRVGALVVVLAAVVVAVTSGCSAIFVEKVPAKVPVGQRIRCTRSPGTPILDSVIAAAATAGAVGAGLKLHNPCGPDQHCFGSQLAALYGVVAASALAPLFAGSAVLGYVHTARCRALGVRGVVPEQLSAQRHAWLPPPVAGPEPPQ